MKTEIKLVAADIDGTFVRSDYTYDVRPAERLLSEGISEQRVFRTYKDILSSAGMGR